MRQKNKFYKDPEFYEAMALPGVLFLILVIIAIFGALT
jgi:hypothetical protein